MHVDSLTQRPKEPRQPRGRQQPPHVATDSLPPLLARLPWWESAARRRVDEMGVGSAHRAWRETRGKRPARQGVAIVDLDKTRRAHV